MIDDTNDILGAKVHAMFLAVRDLSQYNIEGEERDEGSLKREMVRMFAFGLVSAPMEITEILEIVTESYNCVHNEDFKLVLREGYEH